MANMLATGTARLQTLLQRHAATPITYWRGRKSVAFSATKGTTAYTEDLGDIGVTQHELGDYIFPVSLLQTLEVSSSIIEPRAGDVIVESDGSRFEVLSFGGDQPFRYSDPARTQLRVHTKRVSANG